MYGKGKMKGKKGKKHEMKRGEMPKKGKKGMSRQKFIDKAEDALGDQPV